MKSRAGRDRARDVREWLLTFPFPLIPIYSIPIPSRSHSHTRSGRPTVVYDYGSLLFITVRVLHHHRYSTKILIIYYHCTILKTFSIGFSFILQIQALRHMVPVVGKLGTQGMPLASGKWQLHVTILKP